ncbi:growth arrest and DNA damage-inducible 45 [Arctopsyche grandis]|uniref:growth arrest and DNA damage-inducible 45 n=1 Tax=Arctopsyche grandis TaxID=121162 RepID=UPI00406D6BF9
MCLEDQTVVGARETFSSALGKTCMGDTIRSVLRRAQAEKRLTVGLLPAIERLSVACDEALFCFMSPSCHQDSATHMHKVLLEAVCLENDIYLVKVDSSEKLRKLISGYATNDYSCVLVHLPYLDPFTDQSQIGHENLSQAEKLLVQHCENNWNNVSTPLVRLPEQ